MAANSVDPVVPLTEAEVSLIETFNTVGDRDALIADLKALLQAAVEVELATIPIYLYTYYSISRKAYVDGTPPDFPDSCLLRFGDMAGAQIMSVAVEEMLHMSLSSNVLCSMGEQPVLYKKSPGAYPTNLPGHDRLGPDGKPMAIPLAPLSEAQLWQFLEIEYPATVDAPPEASGWETIGQIYSYIRCIISCDHLKDSDFQKGAVGSQIQPFNYSPNNIDTAYPDATFTKDNLPSEPGSAASVTKFASRDDSHAGKYQLVTVHCKTSALTAIATICYQGEGFAHSALDDQSKSELSHYYKFLTLQSQLEGYPKHDKLRTPPAIPAAAANPVSAADLARVVYDYPENPTAARYVDEGVKALVDVSSALYQYMLITTETIFKVAAAEQKLFFNQALHQSMIWILDKLVQSMRNVRAEISGADGAVALSQVALAPSFENYDLGERKDAYANMTALASAFVKSHGSDPRFNDAPSYVQMLAGLPDVSKYWGGTSTTPPTTTPKTVTNSNVFGDDPKLPKFPKDAPYPVTFAQHACMGLNQCKNQGRTLENACAGQGYCSTAVDHTCHVKNSCKHQGGCGLYGTETEQFNPGVNECKSQGSCATPINANRFSTEGQNTKKSVWKRAREVFTQDVWPGLVAKNPDLPAALPVTPGSTDTPELFRNGPTMWWIETYSGEGMTACGASGLSGAGSCV